MNTKGEMSTGKAIILLAVLVVGLVGYMVYDDISAETPEFTINVPTSGGIGTTGEGGGVICPDTMQTAFSGDALNPLNSSASEYVASAWKLVPGGDFSEFTSYTSAASSTRTTAVNLKCGKSYMLYPTVASQDTVNSVDPVDLGQLSGNTKAKVINVPKLSLLKATAYDNLGRSFVYDSADASNSDYENFGGTWKSTTDNATATAMTSASVLDWSFTVITQTGSAQFGNKDLGTYVAVDADKTDFNIPQLWLDGIKLTDVKGTGEVNNNDEATLSAYEYIFKLPADLTQTPHVIRLYADPKSGVDPDVDIKLRTVGKAYYVQGDGYTVGKAIFKDTDSSEILTATAQTMTIDIS